MKFKVISSITTSLRFNGEKRMDLNSIKANLIPFQRMHFPVVSYAPFISNDRVQNKTLSIHELTFACFKHDYMISYNPFREPQRTRRAKTFNGYEVYQKPKPTKKTLSEQFISSVLLYRGDIFTSNVNLAIEQLKRNK